MEKICSFYVAKEGELFDEVCQLQKDIGESAKTDGLPTLHAASDGSRLQQTNSNGPHSSFEGDNLDEEESGSDDDELTGLTKRKSSLGRRRSVPSAQLHQSIDMTASSDFGRSVRRQSTAADDYGEQSLMFGPGLFSSSIMLKKRIISLYVQLCELKSYAQLNRTGFRKVLKKFDKTLDRELKSAYMEQHVDTAYPFKEETKAVLENYIAKMEASYAEVVTGGDEELAKKDLRSHLREHVVWERNTVWRDLIGLERRAEAARLGQALLGQGNTAVHTRLQGDDEQLVSLKQIPTPLGRLRLPAWLVSSSILTLVLCIVAFLLLLFIPFMEKEDEQNCLALLVFVSMLWATEVRWRFVASAAAAILTLYVDDSPVCYRPAHPFPCDRPQRGPGGGTGLPTQAPQLQGRRQGNLRCHVDTSHHAAPGRVHPSCSLVQMQDRQATCHSCAEQGRHPAQDGPFGQHVCGSGCVDAHQQRCGARSLLLHHRGA